MESGFLVPAQVDGALESLHQEAEWCLLLDSWREPNGLVRACG